MKYLASHVRRVVGGQEHVGGCKFIRLTGALPEQIAVSYITVGEIYDVAFAYGNPHAHLSSFRQFLAPFTLLTLNDAIMETFADVHSSLRRRGELISDFDILIGATALHHDLTLLTYNTRHFKRIPDLKLYTPAT